MKQSAACWSICIVQGYVGSCLKMILLLDCLDAGAKPSAGNAMSSIRAFRLRRR